MIVLYCPLGIGELQACPLPDVVFPPLFCLPYLLPPLSVPCKMCFCFLKASLLFKITDEGSKPVILSRIAQTTAALIRLRPVSIDKSISSAPRYDWCAPLSHPSSCILVNHGPSQQSSNEEYKPWKWGATARYYTSHTKTMLPMRKSVISHILCNCLKERKKGLANTFAGPICPCSQPDVPTNRSLLGSDQV